MEFESPMLGAGLIGIGREWGHVKTDIPSEEEAINYLSEAYKLGIRFFDTAPSYGSSEVRLGKFLKTLTSQERNGITVATKFGEHWNNETNEPYTDHSLAALTTSIDQSIDRLGVPDVLLLHKTSPDVLESKDLKAAIEYAQEKGIEKFGASVSDLESAKMVVEDPTYSYIQVPYNMAKMDFSDIVDEAHAKGKAVVVNRPFNMGAAIYEGEGEENPQLRAYRFVTQKLHPGDVALTGTKSPQHLRENLQSFQDALK